MLYGPNRGRLKSLRDTVDAGLNASALPLISVASLVGLGAVVASLPAFQLVSDWVLGIEGGPLVGLALSTNVLSALTGSTTGDLTIALGPLGETYMQLAATYGSDPPPSAPARSTACRTTVPTNHIRWLDRSGPDLAT